MTIEGIVPILPTPFDQQGGVDHGEFSRLVDFAIRSGAAAVGFPAFGSEFYKLDADERSSAIESVLAASDGRIPVIVQCNHATARVAARLASLAEKQGAQLVNTALPRAFTVAESELFDYTRAVCEATSLPVVVQDWNPGGAPVGPEFVARLHEVCPNLSYVKYEDPATGARAREIASLTGGRVGVFSGWGGSHLIQTFSGGIRGAMPGLSLCDAFVRIWNDCKAGDFNAAQVRYSQVAAFVQFQLQTFECFHHCEKRLLKRRGLLTQAVVRSPTVILSADENEYLERLIDHVTDVLEKPATQIL